MSRNLPVMTEAEKASTIIKRSCGTCTLCCSVMGVSELNKPNFTRCDHQNNRGCNIYKDRPQSCHEFVCLWLAGALPISMKPNKVRAVAVPNNEKTAIVWFVPPADRGVWRKDPLRTAMKVITEKGFGNIVICGEERILVGGKPGDTYLMDYADIHNDKVERITLKVEE